MQLKNYQRRVLDDLSRYLELLKFETPARAYNRLWKERGLSVGAVDCDLPPYNDALDGTPAVCIKVPTGGGKTFIASCAVKKIFDVFNRRCKVVVWLVPSEAILTQTLDALNNPEHPYRRRLNADFQSRVAICSKEQCLNGQNFSLSTVDAQLSILVLSYDSFRGRKESLKSRQANGNLSSYASLPIERRVSDAAESSLIQTINRLRPIVIVDESHHAKSALSIEMLKNFNPSMVLELTATPRSTSNLIAIATAAELKREDMVKLPVIVRNFNDRASVMLSAIELRRRLEEAAKFGDRYIRPIVLFQAQPRTSDDSETFDKIRAELLKLKIPPEQIAIRTAEKNELRGVELMSRACPIRYIITVNALREGWDCPFAYVLASLANKTSAVDVEQIVGRILRLPHSIRNADINLNEAYVLTSSARFNETLERIVAALNGEGYSRRDCRPIEQPQNIFETPLNFGADDVRADDVDEMMNDAADAGRAYEEQSNEELSAGSTVGSTAGATGAFGADDAQADDVDAMMKEAADAGRDYEEQSGEELSADSTVGATGAFGVKRFKVKAEFAEDIEKIRLPQFVMETRAGEWSGVESSMFDSTVLLEKENLELDFGLIRAELCDLSTVDENIFKIDATEHGLERRKLNATEQRRIIGLSMTPSMKISRAQQVITARLRQINSLSDADIHTYVERLIEVQNAEGLERLMEFPWACSEAIKKNIDGSLTAHRQKKFYEMLSTERIKCRESYRMPRAITPTTSIEHIARSLYEGEESMNALEQRLVYELTAVEGVRWWHRNIAQREFCINGFINHYPDLMIMMDDGRIIFAETKGRHLDNEESALKARLGREWATRAGDRYKYFMVFEDKDAPIEGVVNMSRFIGIVNAL